MLKGGKFMIRFGRVVKWNSSRVSVGDDFE